jgi:hypothetical protein
MARECVGYAVGEFHDTLASVNAYPQGKRWWVRLHEKGGKQHEMRVRAQRADATPQDRLLLSAPRTIARQRQ